jgi:hypothetical protein
MHEPAKAPVLRADASIAATPGDTRLSGTVCPGAAGGLLVAAIVDEYGTRCGACVHAG